MDKKNYRPISVLPSVSKIFEKVIVHQLNGFFESKFAPLLSGFRKKYSCQDVVLNFVEKCKVALDSKKVYGAVLTDLSKAFDCLPYRLTISKLHAYGVDVSACMLIANY